MRRFRSAKGFWLSSLRGTHAGREGADLQGALAGGGTFGERQDRPGRGAGLRRGPRSSGSRSTWGCKAMPMRVGLPAGVGMIVSGSMRSYSACGRMWKRVMPSASKKSERQILSKASDSGSNSPASRSACLTRWRPAAASGCSRKLAQRHRQCRPAWKACLGIQAGEGLLCLESADPRRHDRRTSILVGCAR